MIDLAHNTHPRPSSAVRAALAALTDADLSEYPPPFPADAPTGLAIELGRCWDVDPARIMLGQGAEGLLRETFRHALRRAGAVALPRGSWAFYHRLAGEAAAAIVEYPVVDCGGRRVPRWTFDADALIAAHARRPVDLAVLPSVDNPTGALFPPAQLAEVADALHPAVVVIDDAYHGLGNDAPDSTTLPALTRAHSNVVLVRSWSKRFGLAGKRCGAGVAGSTLDGLVAACSTYLGRDYTDEVAMLAALRDTGHYEQVRRDMAADRERLYGALPRLGVTVWESPANFVFARFGPAETRARGALEAAGIRIKWLAEYPGCARITIRTPADTRLLLDVLIATLSRPRQGRELCRVLAQKTVETA